MMKNRSRGISRDMTDWPLWLLAGNAVLGLGLIVWSGLSVMPLVFGADPIAPGGELAAAGSAAWFVFNVRCL
jgi:hypothetical protein